MNIYRDPLDVVFRHIPPEALFQCLDCNMLLQDGTLSRMGNWSAQSPFSVRAVPPGLFDRYSRAVFPGLTQDEVEIIRKLTVQKMRPKSNVRDQNNHFGMQKQSVFHLLTRLTENMLELSADDPICDSEYVLRWRDISFRLGQDLFTTAHLAWKDLQSHKTRTYFAWPLVIRSNNPNVRAVMEAGAAENHFHLEGSVPVFHLSWVCLMNHPKDSYRMEQDLRVRYDLHPNLNYSAQEQRLPWSKRLLIAAWIRAHLFLKLESDDRSERNLKSKFNLFCRLIGTKNYELFQRVAALRADYGQKELHYGKQLWCLDYAYSRGLRDKKNEGLHKLLIGERYFLYRCFQNCFSETQELFNEYDQNLFYLYLLIKSNFRSELVQVNQRVGFHNFSDYQDRKSMLWNRYPEYCTESYRMAINSTIQEGGLSSLEVRIMTQDQPSQVQSYIYDVDEKWLEAQGQAHTKPVRKCMSPLADSRNQPLSPYEIRNRMNHRQNRAEGGTLKQKETDFFYVLHFPKSPQSSPKTIYSVRHEEKRAANHKQALALAQALQKDEYLCKRIRGIDACSAEIGCRPEVFATEFRFLSRFLVEDFPVFTKEMGSRLQPALGMTYHVGEDFLSVEDGLRAIDEAIAFLNLKRGSRLGHALALGVDPKQHYEKKGNHIPEEKQDRLDNLVWLLYRSRELSVSIPSDLRENMKQEAESLLDYIYGSGYNLRDYYQAWKLRGNHPDVIQQIMEKQDSKSWSPSKKMHSSITEQYENSKKNHFFEAGAEREPEKPTPNQCCLAFHYLFKEQVNKRGREITTVKISRRYTDFLRQMQEGMIRYMIRLGIAIECNPSSNMLIGGFERYDMHPIFRFNRYGLDDKNIDSNQLCVSINTDDQGVFDTSLEYEYTLLASSMAKQMEDDTSRRYSDQTIQRYLGGLLEMGKMQTFPSAE